MPVAAPTLPLLGDTRSAFRERLGCFASNTLPGALSLEAFTYRGVPILVLFDHDQAVAIRCPYELYQLRLFARPVRPADVQPEGSARPCILVADSGWIVATEDCNQSSLRLLASV